mgnify:CR=1 FL=1
MVMLALMSPVGGETSLLVAILIFLYLIVNPILMKISFI